MKKKIPKGIWALGLVSLLMDTSSELIFSLLPIFLVTTLGASTTVFGAIEGLTEATALIIKIFSGTLSDYLGKRKLLTLIGYSLAALSKPLFPLAGSVTTVFFARFIDRIGKGIRGAPRDALIGEIAPADIRGACFGLRQALDTVGAIAGPLLAMMLYSYLANIRSVLWFATIPALLSVLVLIFGVHEPKEKPFRPEKKPSIDFKQIKNFSKKFWELLIVASILTLARFSEGFLLLKAQEGALPIHYIPLVLVLMNVFYAFSAYPAGYLSDHPTGRQNIILFGIGVLIAADLILGLSQNDLLFIILGVILWGLHMGFTEGILATMVTDTTPSHLRGTAYGLFNLAKGITLLFASLLAGILWDNFGSSVAFFVGASFSAIAFIFLFLGRISQIRL